MEEDLSPEETAPIASPAASLLVHVEFGRSGEAEWSLPSTLSSALVCLCNVGWCHTKGREAHTHPELLLVRDSLSVYPRPTLFSVSCEAWDSGEKWEWEG